MAFRAVKRKSGFRDFQEDEEHLPLQEEEKTIPFLRRLTDMLQENDEVISFQAGSLMNGQTSLGRIVVHDRARVESEVLPKYFNHASFASLRRQLNYFSFTRIGKGRQRGATYCNEGVVELNDILRLKRRAVGTTTLPAQQDKAALHPHFCVGNVVSDYSNQGSTDRSSTIINSVVPVVHLPPSKKIRTDRHHYFPKAKKSLNYTPIVSPLSASPVQITSDDDDQPHITLDLTLPSKQTGKHFRSYIISGSSSHTSMTSQESTLGVSNDEDILAGCKALLSFSSGASHPVAGTR